MPDTHSAPLDALPPAVKRQLVRQIAQLTEKAFRRGFQHGSLAALGEMGCPPPSPEAVSAWRFAKHSELASVHPPGTWRGQDTLVDRLRYETDGAHDLVYRLLMATRKDAADDRAG